MNESQLVDMDQLQVGLYIHLDMKWFDHPFPFSHFKIKNEDQIRVLRSLGLKSMRYSSELSDPNVRIGDNGKTQIPAEPTPIVPVEPSPAMLVKRAMMAQMKLRRETAEHIEKAFINTAHTVRDIEKNIYSRPAETLKQATQLVQQIADSILSSPELAIQVMGDKMGGEELYFHALNVTMLSLMMARDLKFPADVVGALGVGALLHDIGRKEVPNKIY